ncbi:MAG: hypothetical protein ACFE0Q_05185 [Anaerolineae bacterium]
MVVLQALAIWSVLSVPVALLVARFISIAHHCEDFTFQETPCMQEVRTQSKVVQLHG